MDGKDGGGGLGGDMDGGECCCDNSNQLASIQIIADGRAIGRAGGWFVAWLVG